jgi:WD40 repeat protein
MRCASSSSSALQAIAHAAVSSVSCNIINMVQVHERMRRNSYSVRRVHRLTCWVKHFATHVNSSVRAQNACVWSCALNKPALLAATASADFSCKLWDAISGEELQKWEHPHIVRSVHFSDATQQLATACHDKAIRVFSAATPSAAPTVFAGMRDTVRSAKFVNDDRLILLSYNSTRGVDVLDARSGKVVQHVATSAPVTSMNVSYDGARLTTASGVDVGVYSTATMKCENEVVALQQVESASVCAEKGIMAVGGKDLWAYVLEYPSGKPITVRSLCVRSPTDSVQHLAVLSFVDGRVLHCLLCDGTGRRAAARQQLLSCDLKLHT